MTTPDTTPQLKWKIVGDVIGHQMTTKEIVEMYAEEYGFVRPPAPAVVINKKVCHLDVNSMQYKTIKDHLSERESPPAVVLRKEDIAYLIMSEANRKFLLQSLPIETQMRFGQMVDDIADLIHQKQG